MMKFAQYQDCKVAYQLQGKGPTLVFVHGFCEDSTMWRKYVTPFQEKYQILTVDLSGFGASDLLQEPTINAMAMAVDAVLKQEEIQKVYWIGHSMGGYVGLEFSKRYPSKLMGLCLFHSHIYQDSPERVSYRKKSIEFIQKHGVAPFAGPLMQKLFAPAFVRANRLIVDELVHQASTHRSDAVIAACKAMINRREHEDTLRKLACPVLFIIGKEDQAIPYEKSLRQTALPSIASIYILENIGHMGMFEASTRTQQILLEFLEFCGVFSPINELA